MKVLNRELIEIYDPLAHDVALNSIAWHAIHLRMNPGLGLGQPDRRVVNDADFHQVTPEIVRPSTTRRHHRPRLTSRHRV